MPTYALTVHLKNEPEVIEKYKSYHANCFAEVREALKEIGVLSMEIFHFNAVLFMHLEVPEGFLVPQDLGAYLQKHPKCAEWEAIMDELQVPVPKALPNQKWTLMEKVFTL